MVLAANPEKSEFEARIDFHNSKVCVVELLYGFQEVGCLGGLIYHYFHKGMVINPIVGVYIPIIYKDSLLKVGWPSFRPWLK